MHIFTISALDKLMGFEARKAYWILGSRPDSRVANVHGLVYNSSHIYLSAFASYQNRQRTFQLFPFKAGKLERQAFGE